MSKRRWIALVATPFMLVKPHDATAQQKAEPTVLFVCEHGTVKSLLAKVLFEQYAQEVGLKMRAESRGTHADSVVPEAMLRGLAQDHVSLGSWRPRTLQAGDLTTASYLVSLDVPDDAVAGTRATHARWDGLPSVTQDYAKGREAIRSRVRALVDSLKKAERR